MLPFVVTTGMLFTVQMRFNAESVTYTLCRANMKFINTGNRSFCLHCRNNTYIILWYYYMLKHNMLVNACVNISVKILLNL